MESIRPICLFTLVLLFVVSACQAAPKDDGTRYPVNLTHTSADLEIALFAGGCFWCMEAPFDVIPGVKKTISGYTDGFVNNPAYREVARGLTGHTEAIQIFFDPKIVSYEKLLDIFWRNIDPTSKDGQFCDRGTQYRSGIYPYTKKQRELAELSKITLTNKRLVKGRVETEIKMATRFFKAEEYHQDYYRKNPAHYSRYRNGCGRDARLRAIWGAPTRTQNH